MPFLHARLFCINVYSVSSLVHIVLRRFSVALPQLGQRLLDGTLISG